jgi:hypothetical protein
MLRTIERTAIQCIHRRRVGNRSNPAFFSIGPQIGDKRVDLVAAQLVSDRMHYVRTDSLSERGHNGGKVTSRDAQIEYGTNPASEKQLLKLLGGLPENLATRRWPGSPHCRASKCLSLLGVR